MIPTEGLNYKNDVVYGVEAQTPVYIGLFSENYTPVLTDTGATFPTAATETSAYDEATRQLFQANASVAGVTDNAGHVATFSMNAEVTVYGAFLVTTSGKGNTAGKLLSAVKFTTPKTLFAGDVLEVPYSSVAANLA